MTAAAVSALLCLWCVLCHGQGGESSSKNVLFLFTTIQYSDETLSVIEPLIRARVQDVTFYHAYVDAPQIEEESYRESFAKTLRQRYGAVKMDVVIACNPAAIHFATQYRETVFSGAPIVFVGITKPQLTEKEMGPGITGVFSLMGYRETIDLALRLQPDTKAVAMIAGATSWDAATLATLHSELLRYRGQVREIDVVGTPNEQLIERIAALPPHTVGMFQVYPQYSDEPKFGTWDLLTETARRVPTYSVFSRLCINGCIGGVYEDGMKGWILAGNLAVRVLAGERPPIIDNAGLRTQVDWRALQKWHIPKSAVPAGTVLLNREPTLWERYWNYILFIVAVILIQSLAIGGLLIQRYRRRRAEGLLREMTGRLLQTQDEERRRVARELHDGTGQDLAGIALSLGQVLADFPPGHERLRQLLQDSHTTSKLALDEVRAVSYALHPPMLDGLGLVPALRWYLDGLQKRANLHIDFEAPSSLSDATPDIQRTLFRVVQEGVTNVLRHAGGTALKVRLADDGKGIRLEIEDNGQGMSEEELRRARGTVGIGVGIAGMRERVQQLHGTFDINSNAHGTRVSVSLPIEKDKYVAHSAS